MTRWCVNSNDRKWRKQTRQPRLSRLCWQHGDNSQISNWLTGRRLLTGGYLSSFTRDRLGDCWQWRLDSAALWLCYTSQQFIHLLSNTNVSQLVALVIKGKKLQVQTSSLCISYCICLKSMHKVLHEDQLLWHKIAYEFKFVGINSHCSIQNYSISSSSKSS